MDVTFTIQEKSFKSKEGNVVKYYVLSEVLFDGSVLEIPVKSEKARLLMLSLSVENRK